MSETKSGATPIEGDGKRILMILGTPKNVSLCTALGEAYAQGARDKGHVVRQLKLGEMSFDPILRGGYEQSQILEPDLLEAQRQIHWAEHLVFVYPVWWGGIPALLKGFFDRVFLPGVSFRLHEDGRVSPGLRHIRKVAGIDHLGIGDGTLDVEVELGVGDVSLALE